jgi:lysophospholipase L1-like esterase
MRYILIFLFLSLFAACSVQPSHTSGDILVIGDSVLAWNRGTGQDVGRVIGDTLGREVTNRAMVGARLQASRISALGGFSIPDQRPAGPWSWIVMNGGANDLAAACGCQNCDSTLDSLITVDGMSGTIPDLISSARQQAAQVIWVGYYEAPNSRAFAACRPALVELEQRIARHAALRAGVTFLDAEDVMDRSAIHLLAPDRTHPSSAGSAIIGRYIADKIAAN